MEREVFIIVTYINQSSHIIFVTMHFYIIILLVVLYDITSENAQKKIYSDELIHV